MPSGDRGGSPRPRCPRCRHTASTLRPQRCFLVDLRQVRAEQPDLLQVTPVRTMFNYATNSLVYNGLRLPADHSIGTIDQGFRYVIDGWSAERILLASEAIGDGYWFVERATDYAKARVVFGRPIGAGWSRFGQTQAGPRRAGR